MRDDLGGSRIVVGELRRPATNGVSAPNFEATSAISASSVETITLSNKVEARAASIDQAMIGLPQKSRMFFLGIRCCRLGRMTAMRWGYLLEFKDAYSYLSGAVAITNL